MIRSLNDFARKHSFAGTFNKVGLYRDVLHFYNHECSLPFVYGISGLFGFSYYSIKNNFGATENSKQNDSLYPDFKLPPFYTSGDYFFGFNNALRATNVWCQRGAKIDKLEFFELIKTYINEGRPIAIDVEQTNWFKLSKLATISDEAHRSDFSNYENSLLNSTFKIGDYSIFCIGYDDQESTFQILDTHTSQAITISFEDLYVCTNQHDTFRPPANKWFVFYVPPELPEKRNMVSFSILNTINLMINPLKTDNSLFFGIKGLELFSAELKSTYNSFGKEDLDRLTSYLLYSSCSLNSIHDYNRLMFSEFLYEAAKLLNNKKLENVGKEYKNLSANWNEFFSILGSKDYSKENNRTNAFSILDKIIEKEKSTIYLLQESL